MEITVENYINGHWVAPTTGQYLAVESPVDGSSVGKVAMSGTADVQAAVEAGQKAWEEWAGKTIKSRAAVMFKLKHLIEEHADELADLVVRENGKNKAEALASVAKGNETVEWSCSLPQMIQGKHLQVSRGIECKDLREPLGVVACVVPFNFPIMVPMWTVSIALATGNCVILKPSEKVPTTMKRVAELITEAGVPKGVFQLVNGGAEVVNALCDAEEVRALTFVGSSKVAELVAQRCHALNKRVLSLGGAKNHLVALPDANMEMTTQDVVASFAGCAGQRCMAASALILVGDTGPLLEMIKAKAGALKRGVAAGEVGAIIDKASRDRIVGYINEAEKLGVEVLLDGRSWAKEEKGSWVGPTILLHKSAEEPAMTAEIFGPVLSVIKVDTWEEALAIENNNPYGNAACIYTTVGAHAEHFETRFRAGMVGVNIGVPVPREPFSFGGMYGTLSKYGDMDITGEGGMEFFTNRRKITTKWAYPKSKTQEADAANFAGKM